MYNGDSGWLSPRVIVGLFAGVEYRCWRCCICIVGETRQNVGSITHLNGLSEEETKTVESRPSAIVVVERTT